MAERMRQEARREQVLGAATAVFGEHGYIGTTTDAVARAAGVSQPYVVRMFGSKEALFLAVVDRALDRLVTALTTAIEASDGADHESLHHAVSAAYADLLRDRGLLVTLQHAFLLGGDAAIGPAARTGFREVYGLLRAGAGFTADEAISFLASGMLLTTLVALRLADDLDDEAARELFETIAPASADILVGGVPDAGEATT